MEVKIQELHLLIQNSMHFYALKSQTEPAILMSMCPISILVQFVTQLRLWNYSPTNIPCGFPKKGL